MTSASQQKLLTLWDTLNSQIKPKTQDEALSRIANILHQALGEVRILFYLTAFPPHTDPLKLIPCPARSLSSNTFVHEASNCKDYFSFKTESFYYLPLTLNGYNFGYLFLEGKSWPLVHSSQMLVALLALQTVQALNEWRQLKFTYHRPDDSISLRIGPGRRRVWIGERPLYVTDKEQLFLDLLNQRRQQGEPYPRDLLCQMIYGAGGQKSNQREHRLDTLVSRLRNKLNKIEGQPVIIETIRGVGYQLCFNPIL